MFWNSVRLNHGIVSLSSAPASSDSKSPVLMESSNDEFAKRDKEIKETAYYEEEITVEGIDAPAPFLQFNDYEWPSKIKAYIDRKGFVHPTGIQGQALPVALEGKDLVGIARTGSGKTIAFLLPAIVHILNSNSGGNYIGPRVLVLAPTRELAQQTAAVCSEIGYNSVCLFGGSSRLVQQKAISHSNPLIIVGTPGRIIDFIESKWLDPSDVSYLVLDEADRMLDLGFEPQVRRIISSLPQDRQTLMWSATWPQEIQELASEFLRDYVMITAGSKDLRANPNIVQEVVFCENYDKSNRLLGLVENIINEYGQKAKILIFCQTKRRVDIFANLLNSKRFYALGIHGDKSQAAREGILQSFRRGQRQILVATDVASRGLDVDDITHVINVDMPNVVEDYVHRVGRTARQGKKGFSYTFFTSEDGLLASDMVKVLKQADVHIDDRILELANSTKNYIRNVRKRGVAPNRRDDYDNYNDNRNRNRGPSRNRW
ncbi:probable ATP-dependent RNA helicase DDX5 [Panonychus citri]|uniref:probable ATP-dependent RNA helicase DDX5 n=1 Tax=Panonychus citri TaxID=50023 RepID=UPI002307D015|nr:probable ATP-dependent RNA helicase DDX5 [Panonychus citri]